ncbi:hypothetical protein RvY_15128 [Ramazzottius varieornatus]|uniref:Uncharacterized protein n=1 Tax=Ramazzottius varieornatus TaxID=947166 RepID=A0A1D1VYM9_RAMVA|nr:hypothetical protein RvY_15128 [Ramazzottius varieornatus]
MLVATARNRLRSHHGPTVVLGVFIVRPEQTLSRSCCTSTVRALVMLCCKRKRLLCFLPPVCRSTMGIIPHQARAIASCPSLTKDLHHLARHCGALLAIGWQIHMKQDAFLTAVIFQCHITWC